MALSGHQLAVLEAVSFVESHFPNAEAPLSPPLTPPPSPAPSQAPPTPPQLWLGPPGIPPDLYYRSIPAGAPPGLVRCYPPVQAPIHRITNNNASLFGDFARYLDKGVDDKGSRVSIDLTCVICLERKLRVPDRVMPECSDCDARALETLAVLPCGHFFGSGCLSKWAAEIAPESWVPCPLCRFDLAYRCGHDMMPREYDAENPRRGSVPRTLPEGGGICNLCFCCYESEIGASLDRLASLLFPDDIVPGDLKYANSAEALTATSLHFQEKVWKLLSETDHYIRW
ncbi:hypothetical protein F4802DRAFT_565551 [Xylaria palmicola]|nr:hypothetical protein F4802DRAFT_565551 [Xylaria palmicola]